MKCNYQMWANNNSILEIISRDESESFFSAINSACFRMNKEQICTVYYYSYEEQALVISFDGDWKPFFGYSKGFNYPEFRTPITRCHVLRVICAYFQNCHNEITGGRVFLRDSYVFRKNNHNTRERLLDWYWLGEKRLVQESLRILNNHRK